MIRHPRVLVVDDEAPIQSLLIRWLGMWEYPAKAVGSALEALDAMKSEPADIVLCDVAMPERDGLWLAGQLRASWPETTVIMATGATDPGVVMESRKIGAAAYVTKPFDPYVLRQAIDVAAGRLQFRSCFTNP